MGKERGKRQITYEKILHRVCN